MKDLCFKCRHLVDVSMDGGLKTCELGKHKDYKPVIKCEYYEEEI